MIINKTSEIGFLIVAVAQWVRRWSSSHRVVQAEDSSLGGDIYQVVSALIFISVLLGWLRPTMPNMCWHAFEHSLRGKTRL